MDTTVRTTTYVGVPVLHVSGELDVYTVTGVRRELAALTAAAGTCPVIVVDLTAVTFIDSTGLGVLVGARKKLKQEGGTLSLVVASPSVLKTLRISSLAQLFDVFGDLDAALLSATRTRA